MKYTVDGVEMEPAEFKAWAKDVFDNFLDGQRDRKSGIEPRSDDKSYMNGYSLQVWIENKDDAHYG